MSGKKIEVFSPGVGVHVIKIDGSRFNIYPYFSDSLETVESAAKKAGVRVAINAGFFDPANEKTISYVISNGKLTGDPSKNENLMTSEALRPYLSKILNRSEFRVLVSKSGSKSGKLKYDITKHNAPVGEGWAILHSIQAGPELYPELRLEDEVFLVCKDGKVIKESASVQSPVARSAIGIKRNDIYLVAVSNDKKMTIKELADFMRRLGVDKAMAFDGGSSTSLYVDLEGVKINLSSAKNNESRKVKSILLIK